MIEAVELVQRRGRREVLHGLTFSADGGVLGLLGPNGAGKTTLLETVSTLLTPAAGSLKVFGISVNDAAGRARLRRRLGFLPQRFGYMPSFTLREFVEYVGWTKGLSRSACRSSSEEALRAVDLVSKSDDRMGKLSGGMLRRAGIAAAIVARPDLLVLDEPTVGLDPRQRTEFRALLRQIAASAPVIISTHLTDDVSAVCSSVLVLGEGRIIFAGPVDELAALGVGHPGDSPLERGYNAVVSRAARALG